MQHRAAEERIDKKPDGLRRLALSKSTLRRLGRALKRARRLEGMGIDAEDGLRRIVADARLIEAALPAERADRLPAHRGRVRLSVLAEDILRDGEIPLTEARLRSALGEAPLTLRELWAAPVALRMAAAEGLTRVCEGIVKGAAECHRAEKWLDRPRAMGRLSPDFVEHALRRSSEEGLTDVRERLESRLRKAGLSADQLIRQAHDAWARRLMRLDNLMNALRLVNQLDWQRCFEALSEVDAELRRDPAGVYPLMEDDSRRWVLEQVSDIARAAELNEITVARHAVSAARLARENPPSERPVLETLNDISPEWSCCWWLYDDAGRAALLRRMGHPRARLHRITPDPHGWRCMGASLMLTVALSLLLERWLHAPWLLPACVLAAWNASGALVNRMFARFHRPARLLKLKLNRLPDSWRTLIVTPFLLSGVEQADAACDRLEALGCLEEDPNLACLLLGDFADADRAEMPGDDAVIRRIRDRISAMNRRAGVEKYYYLHRPRTLLSADRRYTGRDRKRGALMDLNRLLLGGASAFSVEGAACDALRGRFSCVITLDADTRMLPGTAHRLVGALAHPLNRRYGVLQPRMEVAPSAVTSRFALMYSGVGGLDTYPAHVSSLWMDLTGQGIYGGKGVYRVADFQRAVDGTLPEGRILSHDLIEGALAGTAFLGDVALYDGCPATLEGWMKRQHRWTRGDWQLMPLIFSTKTPLSVSDRFRMLDNLMRSLRAPALWLLAMISAWTGRMEGCAAALGLCFLNALLHPSEPDNWRRSLIEWVTLPLTAHRMADAALRALWRVFVSGRHLMDWVPSADAEKGGGVPLPSGKIAALLTLPGLLVPDNLPLVLALFLLFWVGADWVRDMERQGVCEAEPLSEAQTAMLRDLARDTWRFFAENVTPDGPALPPDNVQLDPPVGTARRTSPTNIGLYLLSCAAACRLHLIDSDERDTRIRRALDAIDRMAKWRGHLFNWVDIDTLKPLPPRYVSAVDSGNLAACALCCAGMVEDVALAGRLRALAEGMDLAALYDDERHLFRIGMDVDGDAPSMSHYDLLASEACILSFTALMLKQAPLKHWSRLGRRCVPVAKGSALASWSGTMFEYLMPELLMRAPALSLLGGSARGAVQAQMDMSRPWGVSESGYHAFDAHMSYQYRAFGLKALALSGGVDGGVIAPYASILALAVRPARAAENIARMTRLGWRDDQGFYEAADTLRPNADDTPSLVKSHMAHHQGMALCALCNALTGDSLARAFMSDPRARALGLLLEERPACCKRLRPLPRDAAARPLPRPVARRATHPLDAHLLGGRLAHALVTADGAVLYARKGIDATRHYGSLTDRPDGANLHLFMNDRPLEVPFSCRFDAGSACFEGCAGPLRVDMTVSLSPEDDTLYRSVEFANRGDVPAQLTVMEAVPVSLTRSRDLQAHPAFQLLFVESEYLGDNGLLFRRRPRNPGETWPVLTHALYADSPIARESRYEQVFDREGHIHPTLEGGVGTVLNPVSALGTEVRLGPGEAVHVCFALRLCESDDPALPPCRPERAATLNRARGEAMLGFLGIAPGLWQRLDRLSALVLDPRLAARAKDDRAPCVGTPREALWPMGISGDNPILSMVVTDPVHIGPVRAMIAAHCFYRNMGLNTDLALVDAGAAGYDRPVANLLQRAVDAAPLGGRDGVFLLSGLTPEQIDVIRRASAIAMTSDKDFGAQATALLRALNPVPCLPALNPGTNLLPPARRSMDNGFGGFTDDGGYDIDVLPGRPTPAPWCQILATDGMGILLTERGGGFLWHANSRFHRLSAYRGDPMRERFPFTLEFVTNDGRRLSLLPGNEPAMPFRVKYTPEAASYGFATDRLRGRVVFSVTDDAVRVDLCLILNRLRGRVRFNIDWLIGAQAHDAAWLRTWSAEGALFASGAAEGVGWLGCDHPDTQCDDGLSAPVNIGENRLRFAIGWAADLPAARNRARDARDGTLPEGNKTDSPLRIETPDDALNVMMNRFLPHQTRSSRVLGRTGYYQPGGAYGFRDQLQDMLALIPLEPSRVRTHLLMCAGRQFAAGDVLHWWHMPHLGVRTRIRDDRLFLPWVAAEYVRQTGDTAVLGEVVPYLADVPIPADREDVFRAMTPSDESGSLHDHCMRAFRATDNTGKHGLALMGAGDWNDGMNRVGREGRGESVWLSEFLAACADSYAEICPSEADATWLRALARRHRGAVELYGWDGAWYLRAWTDDGQPLGSADGDACRIDLISQAWAVLCGLSPDRCRAAMDAAWSLLADEQEGLLRLLTPPFDLNGIDPGYIRGYPGGVRENGAQYTHAACWMLLALVSMGDAERAHRALQMLLPTNHADTPEKARRYRVEPYVMAADVYDLPGCEGRGGWTWYTGSAAWLYVAVLSLLGYERRGDRVRLNALLGPWPEVSVTVKYGESRYRLVCRSDVSQVMLDGLPTGEAFVTLLDDGQPHEAHFPPRRAWQSPRSR